MRFICLYALLKRHVCSLLPCIDLNAKFDSFLSVIFWFNTVVGGYFYEHWTLVEVMQWMCAQLQRYMGFRQRWQHCQAARHLQVFQQVVVDSRWHRAVLVGGPAQSEVGTESCLLAQASLRNTHPHPCQRLLPVREALAAVMLFLRHCVLDQISGARLRVRVTIRGGLTAVSHVIVEVVDQQWAVLAPQMHCLKLDQVTVLV